MGKGTSSAPITSPQMAYAGDLLHKLGYGDRVSEAWRPLIRKLGLVQPGNRTEARIWLSVLTAHEAHRLIDTLKEEL